MMQVAHMQNIIITHTHTHTQIHFSHSKYHVFITCATVQHLRVTLKEYLLFMTIKFKSCNKTHFVFKSVCVCVYVYICMHMCIYFHVSVSQIHCVQHCVFIAAPFYQFPLEHRKYVYLLGCKSKFHILTGSN